MLASVFTLGLALLPSAFAAVHDVQVGAEGKLLYSPEAIFAEPGDQVVFHFHPKNHTVTESSLNDPCGRKEGGFHSEFQPVAANVSIEALPTYTVDVKDKTPMWFYCAQGARTDKSHCGLGMVFSINCGPEGAPNSFTNFKHSALAIGERLKAEAAAASQASPAAPTAYTTAAYGDVTIPAAPVPTLVTQVITLEAATWTTTYSSYPGSPAATPASPEGNVHRVIVGGEKGLVFDPPSVEALPRDTIVFEFRQKNHTVTQSSFEDPCRRLEGGFDSDFQFVAADVTGDFPTFNYTVLDTAPVWAYCRQRVGSHCGAGMTFAVNPEKDSGRTFEAFQNVAKALNGTSAASTSNETTSNPQDDGSASSLAVGSKLAFTAVLGLVSAAFL
ncbi:hypothetical protein BKA70DRAFT_328254 [Coprinopsis sp. MPI-PUGE-AT-0042]|nr:hypothetical protein BKA70DRAFT_328254 [Coprinopsis sp. MPI-PUGE-AT-0042]